MFEKQFKTINSNIHQQKLQKFLESQVAPCMESRVLRYLCPNLDLFSVEPVDLENYKNFSSESYEKLLNGSLEVFIRKVPADLKRHELFFDKEVKKEVGIVCINFILF